MTPSQMALEVAVPGLTITDVENTPEFCARTPRKDSPERHMQGLQRLAQTFVVKPESLLQELAQTALELCEADSAGVTLETRSVNGESGLEWVAVAGRFSPFSRACFPFVNTACGTGIDRGCPQWFRMDQAFYDTLGIQADPVTDGILIPWRTGTVRGTVWIMAHERTQAFDTNDVRLMETLSSFAAMAFRQRRQQRLLVEQASAAAAAAMANELAHSINNPLQSLTNLVYLASEDGNPIGSRELAGQMSFELQRLSGIVEGLLAIPVKRFGQASSAASAA